MTLRDHADTIATRYLGGEDTPTIAIDYGVTPARVLAVLREAGIEPRGRSVSLDVVHLEAALERFHASGGKTCAEYERWHDSPDGAGSPCLATLRNRGVWRGAPPPEPAEVIDPPIIPTLNAPQRWAQRRAVFVWLYQNGLTMTEIAKAAGVDKPAVSRALTDIPKRPHHRTPAETKVVAADSGSLLSVRITKGSTVKTVSTSPEFAAIIVNEFSRMLAERG